MRKTELNGKQRKTENGIRKNRMRRKGAAETKN